jgi:hypothetical protein
VGLLADAQEPSGAKRAFRGCHENVLVDVTIGSMGWANVKDFMGNGPFCP